MINDNEEIEKLKMQIAIYNAEEEIKKDLSKTTIKNNKKNKIYLIRNRIIAITCASLILVSGIAIATNIDNIKRRFNRGLGSGIETAIENGYIAYPEEKFINVHNIGVNVKIEDFVMDDLNLSTKFTFNFDDNIINMKKINNIELSDLVVRDEENRIIYSSQKQEAFEKYCKEYNLDYTFNEFNENYMNSGLNAFIEVKDDNYVKVMYNIYTSDAFPRSKKLYFSFETIDLIEYVEGKQIKYELNGSWNATVDIPKEMYDRSEECYKVINCDNKDFDVYTAKATDTGFEFGVIISNIEEPILSEELFEAQKTLNSDYANKKISKEEYDRIGYDYWNYYYLSNPISLLNNNINDKQLIPSYIENENGEKYECTYSPSRRSKGMFIENSQYEFYETFGMTKYNATQKVKLVLYYYGNPVTIELEKM